jgi:hypothetical protein
MHDKRPDRSRQEVEGRWRTYVADARRKYYVASADFAKAEDERQHGLTPHPDGSFSLRQARLRESAALREYVRVLKIFTDLLVSGKMPDEKPSKLIG